MEVERGPIFRTSPYAGMTRIRFPVRLAQSFGRVSALQFPQGKRQRCLSPLAGLPLVCSLCRRRPAMSTERFDELLLKRLPMRGAEPSCVAQQEIVIGRVAACGRLRDAVKIGQLA